jgi:predicted phosphodiesterase
MRFAIVSDIHANWQAWSAVRDDFHAQKADVVVCLGDVVGYGPSPQRVLNDVRQCCDNILMGNHEAAAVGQLDLDIFNPEARKAAEWTATQLDAEGKQFIGALPMVLEDEHILFVHAEPVAPEEWGYVESTADAQTCFKSSDKRLIFVGHTHFPEVYALLPDGRITQTQPTVQTLDTGARYLVNVGSVGEPRDGSVTASYCLFDDATRQLDFRKVAFDLKALAAELQQQPQLGVPWFLKEHVGEAAPEKREHAIRVPRVATTKIRVQAGNRVRIQVGRHQVLQAALVVSPMPTPAQMQGKVAPDAAVAARQRRNIWLAALFFFCAAGLLVIAAVIFLLHQRAPPASAKAAAPTATATAATTPTAVATKPLPPCVVTLQASDARLHGLGLRKENTNGTINIGWWNLPTDYVSWSCSIPQTGSYEVSIRYAVQPANSGRDFEIICGPARLFYKKLPSTGGWFMPQTLQVGRLQLAAGAQELFVKPVGGKKGGLMNLWEVRLQRVDD